MKRHVDLLLPLVAVALVVGAAVLPSRGADDAASERVDVVETSYVCPGGSRITAAAGQVEPGQERTFRSTPDADVPDDATDASAWSVLDLRGPGTVVTERGREAGAQGFWAGTATRADGGGLLVGRCGDVVEDDWFLGLGSADRRTSTVVLSNLSGSPAIADLTLWGPSGEIDAIDATGVVLDPYEVRRVPIADLAAGEPLIGLRVERRRGVLGAVVADGSTATFRGNEPIEATLPPTTSQVVPGLAGGARGRTLFLLNPGDTAARVDVSIVGGEGPFVDDELQGIKVEAGRMLEVAVPTSARSGRQGYRITSDQPVAATVRVSPTVDDYASLESAEPLDGASIVPVSLGDGVDAPRLVLTAGDAAASVTVTAYDEAMRELDSTTADVAADTTQILDTADVADDAAYLVVRAKGPVVGTATYVDGDKVSSMLLRPVPATIEAPAVVPGE